MRSLTRTEAAERAALLSVDGYEIRLDVTTGPESFHSITTIRFRRRQPVSAAEATGGPRVVRTFVELKAAKLLSARLNDAPIETTALVENRLPLVGLADTNTLVIEAEMAYSNTGEGLHRFVDPADGETYLYATSFIDDAQRFFACFDQPDLKAPITLSVTAPPDWTVAANTAPTTPAVRGHWQFAPSHPLATYFVTLLAGPYHRVEAEHDGIPLALYCRRSLAEDLDKDAEEIFTITRQCFDRFHKLFGVRYPFGKYDQAFVPEFNAGAMENPGLVTLRDDYIYRSAVTESQHELRATIIAHEMAHMWFGDLVTMRWWDDLWLNESFAEYLGYRVVAEATRFTAAWTSFGLRRKAWGYAADQRPSTHPVAPTELEDSALALLNFDGISYAKGAAVLRQLVVWVGDDAFLAGLRDYFAAHAFGNATLADLLAALSRSSGRDLSEWADVWLRQAQVNTLHAEAETDPAGRYASVAIRQTAPADHPALRPHRIAVGLYDRVGGDVVRRDRFEVDLAPNVDGGHTVLSSLVGQPAADVLLVNDGDLGYAKVRLDQASAAAVPMVLPKVADSVSRAVIWTATIDAVRDGHRSVADLVALVLAALPVETEVVVVEDVLKLTTDLVDRYLDEAGRWVAIALVSQACDRLLASAVDHSVRLAAARGLIDTSQEASRLANWRAGNGVPAGLTIDVDLRWRLLYRLVVLESVGAREIEAELGADRSALGEQWAARCRAALPEPAAKKRAWQVTISDDKLSNRLLLAHAEGFWHPEQAELTRPYVDRYFAEIPQAVTRRSALLGERLAALAFPRYAVAESTRAAAAALLARDDLAPELRRAIVDADDDLRLALQARL